MSNAYNTSGTTLGNQRIGSTAVKAGRRPIARNVIDGVAGSPSNDGDYPGDLIVGVSEISDLYNSRFIASASSSSTGSGADIYWNHSMTGNIIPNASGTLNLGSQAFPLNSGYLNGILTNRVVTPIGSAFGFYSVNNLSTIYWGGANSIYTRINGTDRVGIDQNFMVLSMALGFGASVLSPDIVFNRLSSSHMCFNNTTTASNFSIANSYTSANVGEWLRLGFTTATGFVVSDASGTGVHRPLVIQAGSGSNRTSLGLTTANSGQITYGVAPLSGPSGLSRIPIIISGVQYYLLATTS